MTAKQIRQTIKDRINDEPKDHDGDQPSSQAAAYVAAVLSGHVHTAADAMALGRTTCTRAAKKHVGYIAHEFADGSECMTWPCHGDGHEPRAFVTRAKATPVGQAKTPPARANDLVAETDACPNCGERHQDNLVWLNDEDEQVQCSKCNMVYRPNATNAGAAGTKLDLREIPSLATHATPIEDGSDIPETLATATIRILKVHHKNGDLAWVEDMIAELEAGNDLSDYIDTDRDCSPAGPM